MQSTTMSLILLLFIASVAATSQSAIINDGNKFNFANAHFNAKSLVLTLNVNFLEKAKLQTTTPVVPAGSLYVRCTSNITFTSSCRLYLTGCLADESQIPPNGVYLTQQSCLNASATNELFIQPLTHQDAIRAALEQGLFVPSLLTRDEFLQIGQMLADSGETAAWIALTLAEGMVNNRRKRDVFSSAYFTTSDNRTLSAAQLEELGMTWAPNEPNVTRGFCVVITLLNDNNMTALAMENCSSIVNVTVVARYIADQPAPTPLTTPTALTTIQGSTVQTAPSTDITSSSAIGLQTTDPLTTSEISSSPSATSAITTLETSTSPPATTAVTTSNDILTTTATSEFQTTTESNQPRVCTLSLSSDNIQFLDSNFQELENGTELEPNANVTLRCRNRCASLGTYPTFVTCNAENGTWSQELPSADVCQEPPMLQSGNVCAKLLAVNTGRVVHFYDNQQACSNVRDAVQSLMDSQLTVGVTLGCNFTFYRAANSNYGETLDHQSSSSLSSPSGTDEEIVTAACTCTPSPPACFVPGDSDKFSFYLNNELLSFGAYVDEAAVVVARCKGQCANSAFQSGDFVCQSNGQFSPPLPNDSDSGPCDEPAVLRTGTLCAVFYRNAGFDGTFASMYDGQQACRNVQTDLLGDGLNDGSLSIWLAQGCNLTVYDEANAVGLSENLTQSVDQLSRLWSDRISTAACSCQAGCYLPLDANNTFRFFVGSSEIANGSLVDIGATVSVRCRAQCGTYPLSNYTCDASRTWSPEMLILDIEPLCQEPPVLRSGTLCAQLYPSPNFGGPRAALYDGQAACLNVESELLGDLSNNVASVKVSPGCTFVGFDFGDATGASLTITERFSELSHNWTDRISTASCQCSNTGCPLPDGSNNNKLDFFFGGNRAGDGGVAQTNRVLSWRCRCGSAQLNPSEATCQVDNNWSVPLPDDSVDCGSEPAFLTEDRLCATLFADVDYTGNSLAFYDGQGACPNVEAEIAASLGSNTSSLMLEPGCVFTTYEFPNGTGLSQSLTESSSYLLNLPISTASCFCRPVCLIPQQLTSSFDIFLANQNQLETSIVQPGTTITLKCKCGSTGNTSQSTCLEGGIWSSDFPTSDIASFCGPEPAILVDGIFCASFHNDQSDQLLNIFSGQQACSNIGAAIPTTATSISVNPGCVLKTYDAGWNSTSLIYSAEINATDIQTVSCQCPAVCYIPTNAAKIDFSLNDGSFVLPGQHFPIGTDVNYRCRCGSLSSDVSLATCQDDGTWSSQLPEDSWCTSEPPIKQSGTLCATLYSLDNFNGDFVHFYDGQQACENVQSELLSNVLNNATASVRVTYGCTFTAFEKLDGSGRTVRYNATDLSLGDLANLVETASCSCPNDAISFCSLPMDSTSFDFFVNGQQLYQSGFLRPGETVTWKCRCGTFNALNESQSLCIEGGLWTNAMPDDAMAAELCQNGQSLLSEGQLCATLYEETGFQGSSKPFFSGQTACSSVADYLEEVRTQSMSLELEKDCQFVAYRNADGSGFLNSFTQSVESLGVFSNSTATASCLCQPKCIIPSAANTTKFYFLLLENDEMLNEFQTVEVNTTIYLKCQSPCASTNLTATCQVDGSWSPTLPTDFDAGFCEETAILTGTVLCATLFEDESFEGDQRAVFRGQKACRNFENYLGALQPSSLIVEPTCNLVAYASADFGSTPVTFQGNQSALGWFDDILKAVECSCPTYCHIPEGYTNFAFATAQRRLVAGDVVLAGEAVSIVCLSQCANNTSTATFTCQHDETWSPNLPSTTADLCPDPPLVNSGLQCALLYEDAGFNNLTAVLYDGQEACGNVGSELLQNFSNSAAKSLKVAPGCSLTLFQNSDRSGEATSFGSSSSIWSLNFKAATASCSCSKSPPGCAISPPPDLFDYFVDGKRVEIDGVVEPNTTVIVKCRCSSNASLSVCQNGGVWEPALPEAGVQTTETCPSTSELLQSGIRCSTLSQTVGDSYFESQFYDGQEPCFSMDPLLSIFQTNVSVTLQVQELCFFATYQSANGSGSSISYQSGSYEISVQNLLSASCFCVPQCQIPVSSSNFEFQINNQTVGFGAQLVSGSSVTWQCHCRSEASSSGQSTCLPDRTWSPALPDNSAVEAICGPEPAIVTGGIVCATIFNDTYQSGSSAEIYNNQLACSNIGQILPPRPLSLNVTEGCTLTVYDVIGQTFVYQSGLVDVLVDFSFDIQTSSCFCD